MDEGFGSTISICSRSVRAFEGRFGLWLPSQFHSTRKHLNVGLRSAQTQTAPIAKNSARCWSKLGKIITRVGNALPLPTFRKVSRCFSQVPEQRLFVCVSTCHRGRSAVLLPFRVAVSLNCSRLRCRFLPAPILSGASLATLFISPKSRAWRAEDSSCDLVLLFRDLFVISCHTNRRNLVHVLRIKAPARWNSGAPSAGRPLGEAYGRELYARYDWAYDSGNMLL